MSIQLLVLVFVASSFAVHANRAEAQETGTFKEITIVDNLLEMPTRLQVSPEAPDTVKNVLEALGFKLAKEDLVYPPLDQPAPWFGRIYFNRAPGVQLTVDGKSHELKTQALTVRQFIKEQKIKLGKHDRVEPNLETTIQANLSIRVFRVKIEEISEQEAIAFEVEYQDDPGRFEGEEAVKAEGTTGELEKKYKITYEDGIEVKRELIKEDVLKEPANKIVLRGTKPRPVAAAPVGASCSQYQDLVNTAANQYGVSASELMQVMSCESGCYRWADNGAGNYGLFQFNKSMFAEGPYGSADIFDAQAQIFNAAYYFSIGRRSAWGC